MSPILTGVIASGISGNLTPPWSPEGAYDALATVNVGTAVSSISFAGIPSGYKHLQLRLIARSAFASNEDYVNLKVNSDTTGSNYARHLLYGNGSSAAAAASTGSTITNLGVIAAANSTANTFGAFVVDLLDYANVSKNKTIRSIGGVDINGGGEVDFNSILWMNTSAITSIQLTTYTGSNFLANSQFALYGVK